LNTITNIAPRAAREELSGLPCIWCGSGLAGTPLPKRERQQHVLDLDERKLERPEAVLNMMFSLSINTVIVLSGLRTIVVQRSTGFAI